MEASHKKHQPHIKVGKHVAEGDCTVKHDIICVAHEDEVGKNQEEWRIVIEDGIGD